MTDPIVPEDAIMLLRTWMLHVRYVEEGLRKIARDLEDRGQRHDNSKLFLDEFAGFTRINKAAREHPYGSPEYKAVLKQEERTIDLHYSRNRHHPEFFAQDSVTGDARHMGFLDIIEMVCDWRGAYLGYGSQGSWQENMDRQYERYKDIFNEEQWWLIRQVADFLFNEVRDVEA